MEVVEMVKEKKSTLIRKLLIEGLSKTDILKELQKKYPKDKVNTLRSIIYGTIQRYIKTGSQKRDTKIPSRGEIDMKCIECGKTLTVNVNPGNEKYYTPELKQTYKCIICRPVKRGK